MKKTYITPATLAQHIQHSGILMISVARATSNTDVFSKDNSGNAADAF